MGNEVTVEQNALLIDKDRDDGWVAGSFETCTSTQLSVELSVPQTASVESIYLNVLFDWDHNGAWRGASDCPSDTTAVAPQTFEWPIQNLALHKPPYNLEPGFQGTIRLPPLLTGDHPGELWVRFTVSTEPVDTEVFLPATRGGDGWNGAGDFVFGETEDYIACLFEGSSALDGCIPLLEDTVPDPSVPVGLARNNLPVAMDQTQTLPSGSSLDLLLEGFDPDEDSLTTTLVAGPSNGTLSGSGRKQTYAPNPGFVGTDTFVFQVDDGHGGTALGVVTLTVTPQDPGNTTTVQQSPGQGSTNVPPPPQLPATISPLEAQDQTLVTRINTPLDFVLDVSGGAPNVTLNFTIITPPQHGTLSGVGAKLSYTPDLDFLGTDTLIYRVDDGLGHVAFAQVTLVVLNHPPVGNDQQQTLLEDSSLSLILTGSDLDGDPLTCSLSSPPAHGTVGVNADCTASYAPDLNFNGTDSFQFQVDDGFGASDVGTVTLGVTAVNDPPVAANDSASTNEDTPLNIGVLDNDVDVDGDLLTVTVAVAPTHGSVTVNPDGTLHYTPELNFNGPDTLDYTICDPQNTCDTATVTLNVVQVNDPPLAANDSATTSEDTPVVVDVLGNDFDLDGNLVPASVAVLSGPANGLALVNAVTGQISYTPNLNFNGADALTYEVCDDGTPLPSQCSTATVSLTVVPVNDAPVLNAVADQTVFEGNPLSVPISCSDVDGDSLSLSAANLPPGATLSDHGDGTGTLLYTPTIAVVQHPAGSLAFANVQVTCSDSLLQHTQSFGVTVNDVNQPPLAVNDGDVTDEDTPAIASVLSNDSDPDTEDALSVQSATQPTNGSVSCSATQCTYAPNANFNGTDGYGYTVCDPQNACDTATVSVTVIAVNDPPLAQNDSATTNEDTPVVVDVLGNDSDLDGNLVPASVVVLSGPANGLASLNAVTGQVTYTPNLNFNGADALSYQVCDDGTPLPSQCGTATVNLTVLPVNDAPVAQNSLDTVLVNTTFAPHSVNIALPASDVDAGDTLSCALFGAGPLHGLASFGLGCGVLYTPTLDYVGPDSFDYQVCDNGTPQLCATATVTLTVNNNAPTANPQNVSTAEDTPLAIVLTGTDPNGDTLTYTVDSGVVHGTLVCSGTDASSCTYTPALNYNGPDAFTFRVTDSHGDFDTAIVNITVTPVNDPPLASNDSATTNEDTPVVINVLGNDSDLDGNLVNNSVVVLNAPLNGLASVNAVTGQVTYAPNPNFNGSDTLTYQVCDDGAPLPSLCVTATVSLTVVPVNDAPVLTSIPDQNVVESNALTLSLSCSDVEGDTLSLSVTNLPPGATFVDNFNGTGTLAYTPGFGVVIHPATSALFAGLNVTCGEFGTPLEGGLPLSDTQLFDVTVNDLNRLPVPVNDSAITNEDTPVTLGVLPNDFDPDPEDSLSVSATTPPVNGSVTINPDGTLGITPNPNFNGLDTFMYTVSDGVGGTATGTVNVTVIAVNDPPLAQNDSATTNEDTPVVIAVLGNDSDLDGNLVPASVVVLNAPLNGLASVNAVTGQISYTPNLNFNGSDTLSYQVCDDGTPLPSLCVTATVNLTVVPVNDAPVLVSVPDQAVNEGNTLGVNVFCSDVDGNSLSLTATNLPLGVSFVDHGDGTGSFGYTPGFGVVAHPASAPALPTMFSGVGLSCSDGGLQNALSFSITVNDSDRAPSANSQSLTLNEDTSISLLIGGGDLDGDALAFSITTPPAHGALTCPSLPSCTYAPNANYFGPDSFQFQVDDGFGGTATATVAITVQGVQDPPVAVDDGVISLSEDDPLTSIDVLLNDSDPDGDPLTITGFTQGSKGGVNCTPLLCNYTPNANANGADTFTYTLSDGNGGFSTAAVTLTLTPVNDPPTAQNVSESSVENHLSPVPVISALPVADLDGDLLTCTAIVPVPLNGALSLSGCTASYTPNAGFVGADSYGYQVCDPSGTCATATVSVTLVNKVPKANLLTLNDAEDSVLPIALTGSDVNDDPLTFSIVALSGPLNGTLDCATLPNCSYTPNLNYNGPDSFQFQVVDPHGASDTATVNITVNPVNDPPVALDDSLVTNEDTPLNVTLQVSDVEGDPLSCVVVLPNPAHGAVVVNPDCTAVYTPDPNYFGADHFLYRVSDGNGGSDSATVTITVNAVNDAPVLLALGNQNVSENGVLNLSLSCVDVDNPTLSLSALNLPPGATLTDNGDGTGTLSYTPSFAVVTHPTAPPALPVSFPGVQLTCGDGALQSVQSFDLTVNDVDRVPVADAQSLTVSLNALLSFTLTGADGDGDALTCSLTGAATNGVAVVNPDCTASYTPNAGFVGSDSFVFQLDDGFGATATATIMLFVLDSANNPPLATAQSVNTPKNVALSIMLGGFDPDGDALTFSLISGVVHGTLNCTALPVCTYTPTPGFVGADSFVFQACDPSLACSTATVSLSVFNRSPNAVADAVTTNEDVVLTFDALLNDSDPDGDTLTLTLITVLALHGTVVINVDGTLSYTPDLNFNGADSFTYQVCDNAPLCSTATVTVTVNAVADAPQLVAVANQTVNEGITLSLSLSCTDVDTPAANLSLSASGLPTGAVFADNGGGNGGLEYLPAFTVVAHPASPPALSVTFGGVQVSCNDGGLLSTSSFSITVNDVDQPPVANAQNTEINEDKVLALLVSGSDLDGDGLSFALVGGSGPLHGTLNCAALPSCTYTPNLNFNGTDSFVFQVDDGFGNVVAATVALVINPINDPPLAAPQSLGPILEDSLTPLSVTLSGSDVDNDPLTFSVDTPPSGGTLDCVALPSCTYTPNLNFNGTDSFVFQVSDPAGKFDLATVTVAVTPVNDAPTAQNASANTLQNTPVVLTPSVNDVDGDALACSAVVPGPSNGTVSFSGCTATYTPGNHVVGTDAFDYTVCDPSLACATGTLTFNVLNRVPTANPQSAVANEDVALSLTLTGSDPDNDLLSCSLVATAVQGTAVVNADCSALYTPALNFNGSDSFQFQVDDGHGGTSTATVALTILPVNDAPALTAIAAQTVAENSVLNVGVTCSDVDTPATSLTLISANLPSGATLVANGDGTGTLAYTPAFSVVQHPSLSRDFLNVQFSCGDGQFQDVVAFTLTVNDTNRAPSLGADSATVDEDTSLNVGVVSGVLSNDADPDGDSLTIMGFDALSVQGGVVTLNADGSFAYAPALNFNGVDTFTYTVSDGFGGTTVATVGLTINAINDAPLAGNDTALTDEDTPVVVPVLNNDSDLDGGLDPASVSVTAGPSNGSVSLNATTGELTYAPALNFNGADVFVYQVCDTGTPLPSLCASATVNVTVNAVNDAPVLTPVSNQTVSENQTLTLTVSCTDVDLDVLSLAAGNLPAGAAFTDHLDGTGTLSYAPGFAVVQHPSLSALFGGVQLTCSDPSLAQDLGTFDVTVNDTNQLPLAANDGYSTTQNTPLNVAVGTGALLNDLDPDGDSLTVTGFDALSAQGGAVLVNPDGSFTYTPALNFTGADTFTYTVSDGFGGTSTATVSITVN